MGLTKRIYKHAPYHELTDNAVRRVGIDNANEEIVVLDRTREISDGVEEFHGHVREWDDFTSRPTESFEKCKESQQKREDNRSRRKNWIMLKTANEIEKALSSNNKNIVINGIMAMVFNLDDVNWISNHLIELSKHNNLEISSLALTCFGHLARLHGNVGNLECVSNLLKNMSKNVSLGGAAEDAMDDIETFMKINLRR